MTEPWSQTSILFDASGSRVDTECLTDGALMGFSAGGLADMQGASGLLPEGHGDPLLAFEDAPEAGPALLVALLGEAPANGLHQLVGHDGDKQVTVGALRAHGERWDAGRVRI